MNQSCIPKFSSNGPGFTVVQTVDGRAKLHHLSATVPRANKAGPSGCVVPSPALCRTVPARSPARRITLEHHTPGASSPCHASPWSLASHQHLVRGTDSTVLGRDQLIAIGLATTKRKSHKGTQRLARSRMERVPYFLVRPKSATSRGRTPGSAEAHLLRAVARAGWRGYHLPRRWLLAQVLALKPCAF